MNTRNLKIIIVVLILVFGGISAHFFYEKMPTENISQPPLVTEKTNNEVIIDPASLVVPNIHTPLNSVNIPNKPITKNDKSDILKGMRITFNEDFNSLSLYRDINGDVICGPGGLGIWQTVYHFCSRTIPTNNEAEVYIDQNFLDYMNSKSVEQSVAKIPFSIKDGVLAITASPSDSIIRGSVGSWAKYTSGLLTTQFSFSQKYGYFEIRAKMPVGKGLWPAFWLLPIDKSWPPEIDVMEAFGGKNDKGEGGATSIHYATHAKDKSKSCGSWYDTKTDITKDFHTYGVNWQPDGITYYFDGVPYVSCNPNTEANQPFYMLVNLAVGGDGSWPGVPDASNVWPARMYVDYIRAYQNLER